MTTSPAVVDLLEDQHRHIAEMFEMVRSPEADRPAVLSRLIKDLAAHIAVERAIVEPVVKAQTGDDGADLARHLMSELDRMDHLMVLIERRKFNSPDLPDLVTELMDVTTEHRREATDHLLPALNEALSPEEQEHLAAEFSDAQAMTTTHPHPHLLALGPISDKLVAVLSRWDRMRDRTVTNQPPSDAQRDHAEAVRRETEAWKSTRREIGKRV